MDTNPNESKEQTNPDKDVLTPEELAAAQDQAASAIVDKILAEREKA